MRSSLLALLLSAACGASTPNAPRGESPAGDSDAGGDPYTGPTHPENGRIVWASNRNGAHDIYSMHADGSDVVRLTFDGGRGPIWSPDGEWIAFLLGPEGTLDIMRADGGDRHTLCENVTNRDGPAYFWMHDGSGLVCPIATDPPPLASPVFYRVDPETGTSERLFEQNDFPHLVHKRFDPGSITNDGRYLVGWAHDLYTGGYTGDNGTFDAFHTTVVLDLTDFARLYYFGAGCLSSTSPVDDTVVNVSRETPTVPDISRMSLADLDTRASYRMELGFEDSDWGHEYMPRISNDGEWLVYAASVACHGWYSCDYEIFIHRLGAPPNQRERLTFDPGNDNFPSLHVLD